MKPKTYVEKVDRNGEARIPADYLKGLGLSPGEEIALKVTGRHLLVEPVKEAVAYKRKKNGQPEASTGPLKQLIGILEIDDPELIDAIVKSEDIYG